MNVTKFRPQACFEPGFIANTKEGELSTCRFGGFSWSATGSRRDLGNPVLLVTVDLGLPPVSQSVNSKCKLEVPLFSYINIDGIIPFQEYEIDQQAKTVTFKPISENVKLLPAEHCLQVPLPELSLRLRGIRENELSVDEGSYWAAMESFLGGEGAIRICGAPLYIDHIPSSEGFSYFASIGYESPEVTDGLLENEPFFLGELAHYFFVSSDWKKVRVVSQAA